MDRTLRALVFASNTGAPSALLVVMQQFSVSPVWPSEIEDVEVALAVIDRPAQNALKICANLRKQERFLKVPILILLEPSEGSARDNFAALGADIMFKPAQALALERYFRRAIPSSEIEPPVEPAEKKKLKGKSEKKSPPQPDAPKPDAPTLPDIAATTSNPLRAIEMERSPSKGGVVCLDCEVWECRREDAYCSRCEAALVNLEILTPALSFEPLGPRRVEQLIRLKNNGVNPALMEFRLKAAGPLGNRLSLSVQNASLAARSSGDLIVALDARGLALDSDYRAELEILSNDARQPLRSIEMTVERPAAPKVLAKRKYPFLIGSDNEWEFQLVNEGGGTLKLTRVALDETELKHPACAVKGGQSVVVKLPIPNLEIEAGAHKKKLRWEFEHYDAAMLDLEIEALRPARLTIQPPEIDFKVISTRRPQRFEVLLYNAGGEELIVSSVESSVEWARCLTETPLRIDSGSTSIIEVEACGSDQTEGDQAGETILNSNSHPNAAQSIPVRAKFITPSAYEEYIGIDFGTTASCVAIFEKGHPVVIDLDHASDNPCIMPSVLYFNGDGSVAVGRAALQQAIIQPANAVTSIKRALGAKHKRMIAGREHTPTELAAKVISQLAARTEDGLFRRGCYKTPRKAIVTVPVEFSDIQRRALIEAYSMAGLEMEDSSHHAIVRDEAHAAALYYLIRRTEQSEEKPCERVMIFDFGGGTLDCVLIDIESEDGKVRFNTLALGGDPRLGGDDIDWAIVRLLSNKAREEYKDFDTDCLGDERIFESRYRAPDLLESAYRTRAAFKRQAETAKIALISASRVDVSIDPLLNKRPTALEPFLMDGSNRARLQVSIEKAEFEEIIRPLVKRAVEVVRTVCHRAGAEAETVNTILHVGRTSLIPAVRDSVNKFLWNAEDRSDLIPPKLCVAMGAAYWGYLKDQPSTNIEFTGMSNRLIHDIGY
ncbi:MAG TPA: Hsp70 family protein, partial [Blastocatellia bacterium]